jgi:hypothetical protein
MIKAFILPRLSLYGGVGASFQSIAATLLLCVAGCAKDAHNERIATGDSTVTLARAPTTMLIGRVRAMTGLDVHDARFARERIDLTLAAAGGLAQPDSEQAALASVVKRLWDDPQLAVRSETIAIMVARPVRSDGAVERNTYFYYRSEVQRKR